MGRVPRSPIAVAGNWTCHTGTLRNELTPGIRQNHTGMSLYSATLFLSTIQDDLSINFMMPSLARAIHYAHSKSQMDICLYNPAFLQSNKSKSFQSIQRLFSKLYIACAQLDAAESKSIDFRIILSGWCGYELAEEETIWEIVCVPQGGSIHGKIR